MIKLLFLLTLYLFVTPVSVHAYLDPGTGSYITQVLIGFAAGGAYLIKMYWNQIKDFFDKKNKKENDKKDSK